MFRICLPGPGYDFRRHTLDLQKVGHIYMSLGRAVRTLVEAITSLFRTSGNQKKKELTIIGTQTT